MVHIFRSSLVKNLPRFARRSLASKVFKAFQREGSDGTVDFAELTSGLSVLCNCSAKDKFITTFTIHDADGDGLLQPDEVQHFMTSVFRGERAKRSEAKRASEP